MDTRLIDESRRNFRDHITKSWIDRSQSVFRRVASRSAPTFFVEQGAGKAMTNGTSVRDRWENTLAELAEEKDNIREPKQAARKIPSMAKLGRSFRSSVSTLFGTTSMSEGRNHPVDNVRESKRGKLGSARPGLPAGTQLEGSQKISFVRRLGASLGSFVVSTLPVHEHAMVRASLRLSRALTARLPA